MSGKRRAIDAANKRMLNESLPPQIKNIDEMEVYNMLNEIFKNEWPENVTEAFQGLLKKKGRSFPKEGEGCPPGAFY